MAFLSVNVKGMRYTCSGCFSSAVVDDEVTLKRRYLALLPQEQIIEICLILEGYIMPHTRHNVWPEDFQDAIS